MRETIFKLYSGEKFVNLRHALEKRDIILLDYLINFDFDSLLYYDSVPHHLILEAKELYSLYLNSSLHCKETTISTMPDIAEHDAFSIDIVKSRKGFFICDVYAGESYSEKFIEWCRSKSKLFMVQLSETDFNDFASFYKIDVHTITKLKKQYDIFMNFDKYTEFNLIDSLPLSNRAKNALKRIGILSEDELLSITEKDLKRIRSIGKTTCQEILTVCKLLSLLKADPSKLANLKDIAPENKPIPVTMLRYMGVPIDGIDLFVRNNCLTIGDLCERKLTPLEYSYLGRARETLAFSVIEQFINKFESFKDSTQTYMLKNSRGETQTQIAKDASLTRSRIQQVLSKAYPQLIKPAELVAGSFFSLDKAHIPFSDIKKVFPKEGYAFVFKFILQNRGSIYYLEFSDSVVSTAYCGSCVDLRLKDFAEEVIGKGINFYENVEFIETELKKHGLGFLDASTFLKYLEYNRYRFAQNLITNKALPYAKVCRDIIRDYFEFDIKVDAKEDNEDVHKLRQIMADQFPEIPLPQNNGILTTRIIYDSSKMILCGLGRYCPIDKVVYDISLFDEIYMYIINNSQSSFYYSELFSIFREHLQAKTNIDNPMFLHGMLKALYPDDFKYEKSLMYKHGESKVDMGERLTRLLIEKGHPLTKAQIKQAIPGINDLNIQTSVSTLPNIILWGHCEYNHIDNLRITSEERTRLSDILESHMKSYNGYSSESLLFNATKDLCEDFFSRNKINNPQNLFHSVSYLFKNDYRFKRPHIVSKDLPVQEITCENMIRVLLQCEAKINYEQYSRFCKELHWIDSTVFLLFSQLIKDFIRISQDDYIHKNYFNVPQSVLNSLAEILHDLVGKSGYAALVSITDYDRFPKFSHSWNSFLIESLIKEYDIGFRILSPKYQDRRFQRNIIVPYASPFDTFEDLILGVLLSDNILSLSETDLYEYLLSRKLIFSKSLPKELYDYSKLSFKDGSIIVESTISPHKKT